MFKTIKARLSLASGVLVVLSVALTAVVSYFTVRQHVLEVSAIQRSTQDDVHAQSISQWVESQKALARATAESLDLEDPRPALLQATRMGGLDHAFYASTDGQFSIMPTTTVPPGFDPRTRPWYEPATKADGPVVSKPFLAIVNNKPVVSFSMARRDRGQLLGVAGINAPMVMVTTELASSKPTPNGFALLLDKDETVIAHSDPALAFKPLKELYPGLTLEALRKVSDSTSSAVRIQDREYYVSVTPVEGTDWVMVSCAWKQEALGMLSKLMRNTLVTLLIIGLVSSLIMTLVVHRIMRRLVQVRDAMVGINAGGGGDLTQRLDERGSDELTDIAQAFNAFVEHIADVLRDVRRGAESITVASREIATGSQDLSARTEQTASNLQQTVTTMQALTQTVQHSADSARDASSHAGTSAEVANRGGEVVAQVVSTMDEISSSSRRIADIIGTIDGIAFQTNILALNAAVEAARAGEQGRGFAVVASEVRGLAQRSAEAAKEIKSLISSSVERVEGGAQLVGQAGQTMTEIVAAVRSVSAIIGDISHSAGQQSHSIGEVQEAISELDRMTQQNAALVEQSAAAAESLKEQAARLSEVVGAFKLSES
ncbi:methyl-accepting chemotaxis protein [Roseateles sp. BYS180W]|uniref:Methyl-accepting chemotaxis protein n=1 Tax=Roseateles rivi TaxID=3299028 RepID=A0ABW7FT52_9BURK